LSPGLRKGYMDVDVEVVQYCMEHFGDDNRYGILHLRRWGQARVAGLALPKE
jgi:hypothetical protein